MRYLLASICLFSTFFLPKAEAIQQQQNNVTIYKFTSCIDGKEDSYALQLGKSASKMGFRRIASTGLKTKASASHATKGDATNKADNEDMLIVYLHGVSGDLSEPFKAEGDLNLVDSIAKEYPTAAFLSCNYGKTPSWGKAEARIDITHNLRQVLKEIPAKKILFIGNSMGAATALTYAATAPTYIKQKIIGVIAISPCADLEDLYKTTAAADVKTSMEAAFAYSANDKPLIYQQNSLDSFLAFLPKKLKVGIISATEDPYIPVGLQHDVMRDLENHDIQAKQIEIEGKAEPIPIKSILEAMNYIFAE